MIQLALYQLTILLLLMTLRIEALLCRMMMLVVMVARILVPTVYFAIGAQT